MIEINKNYNENNLETMAKKEEILELLNAYKSEVDNFNDAIFTDKFDVLATDIVKLFDIPVVVGQSEQLCECEEHTFYEWEKSENKCSDCGKKIQLNKTPYRPKNKRNYKT